MPNCCQLWEMLNIVWDVVRRVWESPSEVVLTSSRLSSSNRIGETRFSRQSKARSLASQSVTVMTTVTAVVMMWPIRPSPLSWRSRTEEDEEAALRSLHLARDRPSYATPAIEPLGKSSSHRLDRHVWTVVRYRCLFAGGSIISSFYLHLHSETKLYFVQGRENDGT